MNRSLPALALLLALLLALTGCATQPPSPDRFTFAVLGDTPYNDGEEREFPLLIERINKADVDFVIHVGDFKGGGHCSDELYARRRAQFDSFTAPLIYTPGDNEWTDCRRGYMGSMDPLERLARLRTVFFADGFSLGAKRLATEAQDACLAPPVAACGCGAYPENRAWEFRGVRFVTLNVPGSHNNVGFDAPSDAEAACRNTANARWLQRAVDAAKAPGVRALVIAIQANPWDTRTTAYKEFIAQVEATARIGKPVLFVHGDTHTYRADFPFTAPIHRLETFGSPFVGWVKVTVDPGRLDPFVFQPHLQKLVPPQ
jgi:hypothetical protein